MKTTIFTIRADYEHNADIFWTELGQAYPDVADQLRAGAGSATVDLWTWNAIQKLEGFSDGPDYAPAALVVAETNRDKMTKYHQTLEESFAQVAHRMKRVLEIGDLDETQILHLRYVIELLRQVELKTHWLARNLSEAYAAAAETQTTGNVQPTYNDQLDDETLPF